MSGARAPQAAAPALFDFTDRDLPFTVCAMGLEIERRFLLHPERLPKRRPAADRIRQGFLSFHPVVRVRLLRRANGKGREAFLTVKGPGLQRRLEFEYPIPVSEARALLKLCSGRIIEKTRTRLGPWELDRYLDPYRGLWIAEIELKRAGAPLPVPRPPWLGREVTGDKRYTNVQLAQAKHGPPFPDKM